MTNFSPKIALIFLLFYCLTPHTHSKCENNYEKKVTRRSPPATNSMTGIFAEIKLIEKERTTTKLKEIKTKLFKTKGDQNKHPSIVCGAAWIGTNFLITAASCLEKVHLLKSKPPKTKKTTTPKPQTTTPNSQTTTPEIPKQPKQTLDVKAKMQRTYDVNVILMVKKEKGYIRNDSKPLKGKAKIHPLFQRSLSEFSEGMPIGFDVAVVKTDSEENHGIGSLCKPEESRETKWSLIAIKPEKDGTVYEQSLEQYAPYPQKDVGIFISKKVVIGPNHQFTTYSKDLKDEALIAGLPILTSEKATKCIAGISNFYGHGKEGEKDVAYITSTNVSTWNILNWVEHAKEELTTQKIPKKGEDYSEKFWEDENKKIPIYFIGTERTITGTSMKTYHRAGFPVDNVLKSLS